MSAVADSDSAITITWEASTDSEASEAVPFEYFRVISIERQEDLKVKITAQAYNKTYMDSFEVDYDDVPGGPPENPPTPVPGPTPLPPTCLLGFGSIEYTDGVLQIPIPEC